jgi:hypothetical protein
MGFEHATTWTSEVFTTRLLLQLCCCVSYYFLVLYSGLLIQSSQHGGRPHPCHPLSTMWAHPRFTFSMWAHHSCPSATWAHQLHTHRAQIIDQKKCTSMGLNTRSRRLEIYSLPPSYTFIQATFSI